MHCEAIQLGRQLDAGCRGAVVQKTTLQGRSAPRVVRISLLASSKSISSQFTIFANGMLIAFEHISGEFVDDGKRAEISIALSDLIS